MGMRGRYGQRNMREVPVRNSIKRHKRFDKVVAMTVKGEIKDTITLWSSPKQNYHTLKTKSYLVSRR